MKSNHKIVEIVGTEEKVSKAGQPYKLTHAILDTGEETTGFGTKFKEGDIVEFYFDEKHQRTNMVKPGARNE